jgi:hypothetical protein
MKVTWVHPSWRDLVIEHLSSDDRARAYFLRHCAVNGALLALSSAGGASGERRLPLLRRDTDWDALTDRLYDLAPDLEQAELIGVLEALRSACRGREVVSSRAEVDALARAVLVRLAGVWKRARAPIALPMLEAWLALAQQLSPPPTPPALGLTWAELLPVRAPDFSDRTGLERFADWLTLAELLRSYDPKMLDALGFPGPSLEHCEDFVAALEFDPGRVRPRDIAVAARALAAMATLGGSRASARALALHLLAARARVAGRQLELLEHADAAPFPEVPRAGEVWRAPPSGAFDVRRVLADL